MVEQAADRAGPGQRRRAALTDARTAALGPAWSPDGRRLAYSAAPDRASFDEDAIEADLAQRHIWIVNRDGGGPRQLTSDPAYRDERPLWSADGRQLLFARIDARGQASLWLAGADGSAPVQIADDLGPLPDDAPLPMGYYGHGLGRGVRLVARRVEFGVLA